MFKRLILVLILSLAPAQLLRAQEHTEKPTALPSGEIGKGTPVEAKSTHGATVHDAEGDEKVDLLPNPHDPQTWWQSLWVIIIFLVLLAVLYPTAWKSVLAGLKAREDKIRKDIADAEAARVKAETALKDYTAKLAAAENSAREIINKAGTDAEAVAAQIRARSQAEVEEMKEKALKDIEAAKSTALREIYDQTAELATNVAEKILRRNLNANDQRDLVAQSLDQLQDVSKN
jgi:F-type H+-transporting ATPase subunit b